jgi:hypothetical protein
MDALLTGVVIAYLLLLAPMVARSRQSRIKSQPGPRALRRCYLTSLASWWLPGLAVLATRTGRSGR